MTRGTMNLARLVALSVLVSALNACVVPLPLTGVSGEVPEQSIALIKPGISTRADVLLLLGDPTVRGEGDTHFVYSWEKLHGGAVFAAPYPVAFETAESCHSLAIRFAPNGGVAAVRVFHGEARIESLTILNKDVPSSGVCGHDTALTERIEEWLAEPSPVSE